MWWRGCRLPSYNNRTKGTGRRSTRLTPHATRNERACNGPALSPGGGTATATMQSANPGHDCRERTCTITAHVQRGAESSPQAAASAHGNGPRKVCNGSTTTTTMGFLLASRSASGMQFVGVVQQIAKNVVAVRTNSSSCAKEAGHLNPVHPTSAHHEVKSKSTHTLQMMLRTDPASVSKTTATREAKVKYTAALLYLAGQSPACHVPSPKAEHQHQQ